jgi:hypothetical protein
MIEITEDDIKKLAIAKLKEDAPGIPFKTDDVQFLVKTKQNYKAEWESGSFRATIVVDTKLSR